MPDCGLTACGNYQYEMTKALITVLAFAAALACATAAGAGRFPGGPQLPAGWSHAEINVTVKGTPHTLVYDRGRVVAVSPTSITLRERDGTPQVISVSSSTQVRIAGQPGTLAQVRRFELATTLRVDGGDAMKVTVQIPPGLAALIAREQAKGQRAQNPSSGQ